MILYTLVCLTLRHVCHFHKPFWFFKLYTFCSISSIILHLCDYSFEKQQKHKLLMVIMSLMCLRIKLSWMLIKTLKRTNIWRKSDSPLLILKMCFEQIAFSMEALVYYFFFNLWLWQFDLLLSTGLQDLK